MAAEPCLYVKPRTRVSEREERAAEGVVLRRFRRYMDQLRRRTTHVRFGLRGFRRGTYENFAVYIGDKPSIFRRKIYLANRFL